jgi:hypothetical protein
MPAGTSGTSGTSHSSAVSDVPAAAPGAGTSRDTAELAQELPADPVPAEPLARFRAWSMFRPDGSRAGVMLDPGGMDHAEALAAVDRWPGMTVDPILISEVTP